MFFRGKSLTEPVAKIAMENGTLIENPKNIEKEDKEVP